MTATIIDIDADSYKPVTCRGKIDGAATPLTPVYLLDIDGVGPYVPDGPAIGQNHAYFGEDLIPLTRPKEEPGSWEEIAVSTGWRPIDHLIPSELRTNSTNKEEKVK